MNTQQGNTQSEATINETLLAFLGADGTTAQKPLTEADRAPNKHLQRFFEIGNKED